MIKKILFAFFLLIPFINSNAQFGLYASAVYININGSSSFYNNTAPGLGQDIGSVSFQGANFGVFEQNTGNLKIIGSEIKTFKGVSDNVCSGTMNYTVYPVGARPVSPVFSSVVLGFYSDCFAPTCGSFFGSYTVLSGGGCCSAGDQKWQNPGTGLPVNIDLTNNTPGVYTLEVYYDYTGQDGGNGCGTTKYDNNNNNPVNYTAGFTITAPVPVSFGNISIINNSNTNNIHWKTYSEAFTAAFKLERSGNGTDFYTIGEMPAAGFSSNIRNYMLQDRNPLNGINYYRIKMTEADGKYQNSAIVKTTNKISGNWYLLSNPVKGYIEIRGIDQGDEISLVNPAGQKIYHSVSKGNQHNISTTGISAGIYFISVSKSNGTEIKQVIISN